MVAAKHKAPLYCHMNGELVGKLERKASVMQFTYADSWINSRHARPISVSLPLTDLPYKGDKVESYFDNLLPDSINVRKAIAEKVQAKSAKPFDLLAGIGRDCVGALTLSDSADSPTMTEPKVIPLSATELARHVKDARTGHTFGIQDGDFRFSLAGAQDKTALTWLDDSFGVPIGSTPTTHILKPHIISNNPDVDLSTSVQNEWFCLTLLKHLITGDALYPFSVANTEILEIDGNYVLSVERFDRRWHNGIIYRLPQEDFCQALGVFSEAKCENDSGPSSLQIAEILSSAEDPYYNKINFLRCQFIFYLLAAIDGHAKNFSIFIRPAGKISMTPIYDVMSAYPYFGQGDLQPKKIKMAMAVRSKNVHYKWCEIMPRHWLPHAAKHGLEAEGVKKVLHEVLTRMPTALANTKRQAKSQCPYVLPIADIIEHNTLKLVNKYKRIGF